MPPENEALPCPPPRGAVTCLAPVTRPSWRCRRPRTDGTAVQLGTKILYIGGSDGTTAQNDVWVATLSGVGNFDTWTDGPTAPRAALGRERRVRCRAAIYVIGGYDADGKPTTTVFVLTPDPQTGVLGEWQPVADA